MHIQTRYRTRRRAITLAVSTAALAAIIILLGGCGGLSEALARAEEVKSLELHTPDLTSAADGTYRGSYDAGLTKAEVETTLQDGRITAATLVSHEHGRGKPAEALVDTIVTAQSVELDVVSGATISSKVILKAAERSLQKSLP
jgi:uncharacterized protein with FMN-binding domain